MLIASRSASTIPRAMPSSIAYFTANGPASVAVVETAIRQSLARAEYVPYVEE